MKLLSYHDNNRVIHLFHHIFGRELIVLHTILSMFVKFLVHTWGWSGCLNKELIYLSIGAKLILTLLEML